MKRYVIEREIPGASELSETQLAEIAGKSDDEDAIREHARRGGFPANSVTVIANEFGPHTAQSVQLK